MLDAIATLILTGMMLVPVLNVLVGLVAGGASFGMSGGLAGGCLGLMISLVELRFPIKAPRLPRLADVVEFPTGRRFGHVLGNLNPIAIQSAIMRVVSAR